MVFEIFEKKDIKRLVGSTSMSSESYAKISRSLNNLEENEYNSFFNDFTDNEIINFVAAAVEYDFENFFSSIEISHGLFELNLLSDNSNIVDISHVNSYQNFNNLKSLEAKVKFLSRIDIEEGFLKDILLNGNEILFYTALTNPILTEKSISEFIVKASDRKRAQICSEFLCNRNKTTAEVAPTSLKRHTKLLAAEI